MEQTAFCSCIKLCSPSAAPSGTRTLHEKTHTQTHTHTHTHYCTAKIETKYEIRKGSTKKIACSADYDNVTGAAKLDSAQAFSCAPRSRRAIARQSSTLSSFAAPVTLS